jgi:diguanylate cyclase (GGDEF)-like protein
MTGEGFAGRNEQAPRESMMGLDAPMGVHGGAHGLDSRARELYEANLSLQLMTDTLAARVDELEGDRARMMRVGRTDALTGVFNRGAFLSGLTEKLAAADRFGTTIALFVIDLDRFKEVNDTLGHEAGDLILQEVAARLSNTARGNDVVARLGGDEFALVAEMNAVGGEGEALALRMLAALTEPMRVMGRIIAPGASIGLALYPDNASDAFELQRYADMALYRAKANGRGTYSLFDDALREEGERRRRLEADLRRAIAADEIVPWFQPVVDAASGRIAGVEVLARWNHPQNGLIGPDQFVPMAEEMGLIAEIDAAVFAQACAIARPWVNEGLISSIACNVSPRELLDPDFADDLIARTKAHDFPPSAMVVEITETFLLHDMQLARRHIETLAAHDIRVALDDFGIGYSNLRALMQLPIATVKIDRSLTIDIVKDERVAALVRLLAQTTQALGLGLVAEGVEDEDHARKLLQIGCAKMQGYYFARPMPAQTVDAFIRAGVVPGVAMDEPVRNVA